MVPRVRRILGLGAVIASLAVAAPVEPAAADGICLHSGGCGWVSESYGPTFCYWAVAGVIDGYHVAVILGPYEENSAPPTDDSFVHCESGF